MRVIDMSTWLLSFSPPPPASYPPPPLTPDHNPSAGDNTLDHVEDLRSLARSWRSGNSDLDVLADKVNSPSPYLVKELMENKNEKANKDYLSGVSNTQGGEGRKKEVVRAQE